MGASPLSSLRRSDTARFAAGRPASAGAGDYFLSLGRLIPYKRVDLAVEACTRLKLPLLVGGDGRDRARLERMAGPTVKFLGRVPDADVPGAAGGLPGVYLSRPGGFWHYARPGAGRRPAGVALAGGGALDIVQDGVNGVLFPQPEVDDVCAALERFERLTFDAPAQRRSAERFDQEQFVEQLRAYLAAPRVSDGTP